MGVQIAGPPPSGDPSESTEAPLVASLASHALQVQKQRQATRAAGPLCKGAARKRVKGPAGWEAGSGELGLGKQGNPTWGNLVSALGPHKPSFFAVISLIHNKTFH